MTKYIGSAILLFCGFLTLYEATYAAEASVPEPFQRFDDTSKYAINYDDLTALLKTVVVDVGRSSRRTVQSDPDVTGTRMKSKVKRTANEGNRFYFETFEDDEEARDFLRDIQNSLEQLPSDAPLEYFSRDEQLAYWLNLYNVTVLNEIIAVYPKKNLKKLFRGKNSIFSKKLLTVAGVSLSLNDIQFTILKQNYDNNPLIMYGLYQGIIGGPNIRKIAYSGADVNRALENNAYEFVNSNRGTYTRDEKTFRVSSLYERNRAYFPQFDSDLREHLLTYLEGKELTALPKASRLKPDIDDWSVTDLGGTHRRIGGSFAHNRAALLDSVRSTVPADGGGVTGAAAGYGSATMASKGERLSRFEPELLELLRELNEKRMATNQQNAAVSIEDLEESPAEPATDTTAGQEATQ